MRWDRNAPDDADLRLVRPYALTRGRTRAAGVELPLETLLVATDHGVDAKALMPEQRRILKLTATPTSVAEVSAHLAVPVGVARVLVGDLITDEHVTAYGLSESGERPGLDLLTRVLHGLQSL